MRRRGRHRRRHAARRRARRRAGATGYTGQELLRLLARHPGGHAHGGDVVRRHAGARAAAAGAGAHLERRDRAARRPDALRARGRHRVSRAARQGCRRARARAGGRRRARHRSVRRVPAARRRGARRGGIRKRTALPAGVAYGLTERERGAIARRAAGGQPGLLSDGDAAGARAARSTPACIVAGADVIVDAKSGVSGAGKTPSERTHFSEVHGSMAAYGVFAHRHGAEIEQGAGRDGHVHAAPGAARSRHPRRRSTCASRPAPPRTRSATCSSAPTRGATFVRLTGAALPEIKHVAHTNFCDIGWRVRPVRARRAGVGHRQPAQGRVGPGRAEHERDAGPRRDGRGCCDRPLRPEIRRRAARRSGAAWRRVVAAHRGRSRRAGVPLVRRARRRQGDRRGAEGGRHREAAGRRPAHHRRGDARRRRRRAGRSGQYAAGRGAARPLASRPSD